MGDLKFVITLNYTNPGDLLKSLLTQNGMDTWRPEISTAKMWHKGQKFEKMNRKIGTKGDI